MRFKVDVFRTFKVGFPCRLTFRFFAWDYREIFVLFRRRGLFRPTFGPLVCRRIAAVIRPIRCRARRWSTLCTVDFFLNVFLLHRTIGYQRESCIHTLGGDGNRDLAALWWGGDGSRGTRGRNVPPITRVARLGRHWQAHGRGFAGRNRDRRGNSGFYLRWQLCLRHRGEKQRGRKYRAGYTSRKHICPFLGTGVSSAPQLTQGVGSDVGIYLRCRHG